VFACVASLSLTGTRWAWLAAVVFTLMANPRLLVYQLTALLAGLSGPGRPLLGEDPLVAAEGIPALRSLRTE
jgi:hypothetical protein